MNAEFNWWLLIVGLVGGAGLLWLVLGDFSRREEEVDAEERSRESTWIAEVLGSEGQTVDPGTAEEVLRLHRLYLRHSRRLDPLEVAELQDDGDGAADLDRSTPSLEPPPPAPAPRASGDTRPDPARAQTFETPIRRNPLVED